MFFITFSVLKAPFQGFEFECPSKSTLTRHITLKPLKIEMVVFFTDCLDDYCVPPPPTPHPAVSDTQVLGF